MTFLFAPFSQAHPIKTPVKKEVCEIIESNDNTVLVKTEGGRSWKTVVECIKKQSNDKSDYLPFSASHNPDLSIRQSLINPINSFVTEKHAQKPQQYVSNYTRINQETGQKSDCYEVDSREECQFTQTASIPEIAIRLKKLPPRSVVHTKVLYSETDQPLIRAINAYQNLLTKGSYLYGVYLNVVLQPSSIIAFVSASTPGVVINSELFFLDETGLMTWYRYKNQSFNHFGSMFLPNYLGGPEQRQEWYEQMHSGTGYPRIPKKDEYFTGPLNEHFFYERHPIDSNIEYRRIPVSSRQLKTMLSELTDKTAEDGKFPCMRSAFYGLRVTALNQGSELSHVMEVITKKTKKAEEETCLKQAMAPLIAEQ
ncbi:hypothetical protein [Endozoicomonas lisbonensis]